MKHWQQETSVGALFVSADDGVVFEISFSAHGNLVAPTSQSDPIVESVLNSYFAGSDLDVDVDIDLNAVSGPFHRHVLEVLRKEVPAGETVTYGELAVMAGSPGAARAVGEAMRTNPVPIVIPCHRVVSSTGLGGYLNDDPRGSDIKRWLLTHEGASIPS